MTFAPSTDSRSRTLMSSAINIGILSYRNIAIERAVTGLASERTCRNHT